MAYEIHNQRPILSNFRQSPSKLAPGASLSHGHTACAGLLPATKRLNLFKTARGLKVTFLGVRRAT
jgi:hypothetical protein